MSMTVAAIGSDRMDRIADSRRSSWPPGHSGNCRVFCEAAVLEIFRQTGFNPTVIGELQMQAAEECGSAPGISVLAA
ncbi:hypothetical protein [Sterolibacterium denitrificans]|uniref:hypothetical protein n=1 Tax=Sterolibacterium denitrificans TaxID=157592 RepID=UPI0012B68C37|nr:hypothetical protein [Sterolibacterium denitrificans]